MCCAPFCDESRTGPGSAFAWFDSVDDRHIAGTGSQEMIGGRHSDYPGADDDNWFAQGAAHALQAPHVILAFLSDPET
jgi:hypothetical protein